MKFLKLFIFNFMLISTLHRAGNEKDGDEQADTVGCCSLRVEHIELHEQKVPALFYASITVTN